MGPWMLQVCIALMLMTITVHVVYVCLLHKRRRRKLSRASLLQAPGPVGLPLIGNFLYFVGPLRRDPHRGLARFAEAYGPVASFRPGKARDVVVVSSPGAAREALAVHDVALAARPVLDGARALAHGAGSVFFLPSSSALWRRHRATVGAHLSSGRGLGAARPARDRAARRLAEHLRACACSGGGAAVAVGEPVLATVLNGVSGALFSREVVDIRALDGTQVFKDIMVELTAESARPNISDAFPCLAPLDLFGCRRSFSRSFAKLYKFLDEEFVEPRLASGESHGDMLDAILAQYAKSQITRSEITKFLADMFISGSDTSTVTVQWAMAELLRHPEKMSKVRAELAASLGSKDFVEDGDLDKLPYLQAVVKEALRLHPAVPLLPREVVAGGVSLGGFPVPIGACVAINLWAIGRDRDAWPRPEEFMPERFLGDRAAAAAGFRGSPDFAYKPFGAGRRVCPGMDLAARFVPHLLASVLHRIEWRLPGGMRPEDVDLTEHHRTTLDLRTPLRAVPVFVA
ncbi:hypothetical protein ACP4OV_023706 [Aristida adscensionis]